MLSQESWKTCFKCGKTKPLSEFYVHRQIADGHLNKCKECTKADSKRTRTSNPGGDFDRRLKRCKEFPTTRNAYKVVDAALKSGRLKRPDRCSGCGCSNTEHRIEAHHYDYSRPLDVIWLCTPCHRRMDERRRKHEGKE